MKKFKQNMKRALVLKNILASKIKDERLSNCGRAFSLKCKQCDAISISKPHLQLYFCGRTKFCPICMKIQASHRSNTVSQAIIELMHQYEEKGTPVIPTIITLTIPHDLSDPLESLLSIISEAWKKLRQGGDNKTKIKIYRAGSQSFWREYFIGEVYALEMPWNPLTGWHVHLHIIALRYLNQKVPLGTNKWLGCIQEEIGLRSIWHTFLKEVWNTKFSQGKINRTFPVHTITMEHIEKAEKRIQNAKLRDFPDIEYETEKEKFDLLEQAKKEEFEKLKDQEYLGKEIATQVDVKMLFYEDKKTGKRIPMSWLLSQPNVLKNVRQMKKNSMFLSEKE